MIMNGEIEVEDLSSRKDATVIDVRTNEEFGEGHLPGAINVDVRSEDFASRLARMEKAGVYIVYCGGGRRGSTAKEKMEALGFEKVLNLKGGFKAWRAANPDS